MNVQFAVKDNEVYLIEVNPRAARTVPFVSKATGVPLAKVAARVMAGKSLTEQGVTKEIIPPYYSVKEVVLPFNKFPGVDPHSGPYQEWRIYLHHQHHRRASRNRRLQGDSP